MGSGTTAQEAQKTGRAFFGCDLFYEDTRAKRLEAVSPDLVTMLPGVTDQSIEVWQAEAQGVHRPAVALTIPQRRSLDAETADLFGFSGDA